MTLARPNPQLQLSLEERETLERWVRRPSSRLTAHLNAGGLVGGAASVACAITVAGQRGAPNWRSTDRSAADRIAGRGAIRDGANRTEHLKFRVKPIPVVPRARPNPGRLNAPFKESVFRVSRIAGVFVLEQGQALSPRRILGRSRLWGRADNSKVRLAEVAQSPWNR